MQNIIKKYVSENRLEDANILVAYSGGADSTSLLHACALSGLNPVAIHLNHAWRGDESDAEEDAARSFCEKTGVKFYSEKLSDDIKKTETCAREARYAFFEKCVTKFNADAVFLAHNKNDNVETLLYRLIKGTGIEGLCAIPKSRGKYHRPFLDIKRSEIEEYAAKNNLSFANDSSNKDLKYARNFIREEILPKILQLNPGADNAISNLIKIANSQKAIIEELTGDISGGIDTRKFLSYSKDLRLALLHRFLKENLKSLSYEKIAQIHDFILENSSGAVKRYSLSENFFLEAGGQSIVKVPANPSKTDFEISVNACGEYIFEPLGMRFKIEKAKKMPKIYPKETEPLAYVTLKSLEGLTLRTRREGDVLQPFGMSGKMKLKDFLINRKIPRQKRDTLLLLTKQDEVLWIPTLCLSEKLRADKEIPPYILRIEEIC